MPLHDFHVTPLLAANTTVYSGTNVRFLQTISQRCCCTCQFTKRAYSLTCERVPFVPLYKHVTGLLNIITLQIGQERERLCGKLRCWWEANIQSYGKLDGRARCTDRVWSYEWFSVTLETFGQAIQPLALQWAFICMQVIGLLVTKVETGLP